MITVIMIMTMTMITMTITIINSYIGKFISHSLMKEFKNFYLRNLVTPDIVLQGFLNNIFKENSKYGKWNRSRSYGNDRKKH